MSTAESLKLAALTTAAWTAVLVIWLIATVIDHLRHRRSERRDCLFAPRRYAGWEGGSE